MTIQLSLFDDQLAGLPEGLRYRENLISPAQERRLVAFIASLPLKPFEFAGGFQGNRRVLSFGWHYDFNASRMQRAADVPAEFLGLREVVAAFAGVSAEIFEHVLVTEYAPGAGIGWHKDRPVFNEVVGVSLLAPCRFRMRRKTGTTWQRTSFIAEPRSAYLLSGGSRWQWEHSIPPVPELRYSVTFRNLRVRKEGQA
jgi:alkylated DNA repair dioxygenase AlkB